MIPAHIIIDSGPAKVRRRFRALLEHIQKCGEQVDLLCFTHIDDDYIRAASQVIPEEEWIDNSVIREIWMNVGMDEEGICGPQQSDYYELTVHHLNYLQDEVMKMCQSHGLNQIDLKNSEQRITDAEYHTKQHGQKVLDKENAEKKARGEKSVQRTFETEKEKIRKAILDVIEHSVDENEFKKKLYEIYGIAVKESRGRWSYLPPGRERPITGKKLGDAFEKAAVINAILGIENETFDHSEQKSGMDKAVRFDTEIIGTESIGRVIDIENSEKAKASAGYEYWAKLHNLQEQSKTLNYLTENGLLDGEKLDKDLAELTAVYQQCRTEMKETESELKSVNRQLRLLGQYYKTKKIYQEYAKGGKKKDYLAQHQSDIELYEVAMKEMKEIFGDGKLPDVQMLKEQKAKLMAKKQKQYEAFKVLRLQWMELRKLAQNRDSILAQDKQNALVNKKPII